MTSKYIQVFTYLLCITSLVRGQSVTLVPGQQFQLAQDNSGDSVLIKEIRLQFKVTGKRPASDARINLNSSSFLVDSNLLLLDNGALLVSRNSFAIGGHDTPIVRSVYLKFSNRLPFEKNDIMVQVRGTKIFALVNIVGRLSPELLGAINSGNVIAQRTTQPAGKGNPLLAIIEGSTNTDANIPKNAATKVTLVKVRFKFLTRPPEDTTLEIKLFAPTKNTTSPRLLSGKFKTGASDWFESGQGKRPIEKEFEVLTSAVDTLAVEENVYMGFSLSEAVHHLIIRPSKHSQPFQTSLLPTSVTISPYFSRSEVPHIDTVPIKIRVHGKTTEANRTMRFNINDATGRHVLITTEINIDSSTHLWDSAAKNNGVLDTVLLVRSNRITKAVKNFKEPYNFKITMADDDVNSILVSVTDKNYKFLHTSAEGFTYLNAINFDFENSSGAAYVGHLNIFKYYVGRRASYKPANRPLNTFGMNLGIMKINYSKGGDSVNTGYNYEELVKEKPLDRLENGMPYYRQYNNLKTVSKNTSWSFYFQPMFNLIFKERLKLMVHLHSEFFINNWHTTTTIKNIQQVSDTLSDNTPPGVRDGILDDNRFALSTSDPITVESSSDRLLFYWGGGLTLYTALWEGGSLFVQPTFGGTLSYSKDTSTRKDIPSKISQRLSDTENSGVFHLVRFELKQTVTEGLKAVVGVNVRGKFGHNPSYAAYIGFNLGVEKLKDLVK